MHAKQEEVLLPGAIAHSPHVASHFIFLHPYIFADPTLTYSACTPANGFHRMCSNLVLPPTFHPGNRVPGLWTQINRNGIQFAITKTKSFCVLQDPSLLLACSLTMSCFIKLLHFHFLIAGFPLSFPFPALFYIWFPNPTKSLIMDSLPLLNISTVVLPPNYSPKEFINGLALTRHSLGAHLGPSATSRTPLFEFQ